MRHPQAALDITLGLTAAANKDIEVRAKKLVAVCFRNNTILEDLHSSGKISDAEIKELMIACVDNVYTFLSMTKQAVAAFPEPEDWQDPKLNKALLAFSMLLRGVRR